MRLILFYPEVATRSCADCQKWWYDDAWIDGKMRWSTKIVERAGVKFERPKDPRTKQVKTPCEHCPKKSPELAHKAELSPKNWQAYQFYRQVQATHGACLTQRQCRDALLLRNLALIDGIVRAHEQNMTIAATSASVVTGVENAKSRRR